jgi:methionyl-tRNA formyltransferase
LIEKLIIFDTFKILLHYNLLILNNNMSKIRLGLFFNNLRGLEVYKFLKKKFDIDIYLSQKNLNKKILKFLNKDKITIIKKIDLNLINNIKKRKYYLLITAGWPLILPRKLFRSSTKGTINLHAGKLPKYRGGSPLNWQIINNEKKIGINILKMTKNLDSGPIYCSTDFSLKNTDDISSVHKKVNGLFPKMVSISLTKIRKGIKPKKQISNSTHKICKQRNESDGEIIWNKMNSLSVFNFVRAITKPYPGAYYYNKRMIKKKIYKCKLSKLNPNVLPGTEFKKNNNFYIKCKKYSIKVIK